MASWLLGAVGQGQGAWPGQEWVWWRLQVSERERGRGRRWEGRLRTPPAGSL